jgi:hypothetical protein
MLRLMIGGLAAITAGLMGGLAVMPVKASPRTVVFIAGPSTPLPEPAASSKPDEAIPSATKGTLATVPSSVPRIHTADEPAPPASAPASAASKKAKSTSVATARAKPRIRIARRDDDDDDDDRC